MTYSQELAAFVCTLTTEKIPEGTRARARQLMTDTLGVGLAGTRHPNFKNAMAAVSVIPGTRGDHPVIGCSTRFLATYAVLANGVACHVLDFDDTHTASIVHGSAIFLPLVLALGEELGRSGKDVQTAFVAGWEVAARVGIASGNSFHNRGFHSTAIAGIFGATAAAGKLLDLTPEQMTHAFGLAGSQASGITEFLTNSSSSKGYHVGWAARSAMEIGYLARAGATGPFSVFEGTNGLLATHGLPDRIDPPQLAADLGARWETERVSIKPYPCCHFAHGAIDCAIALRQDGIVATDVQNIHAIIDEVAAGFVCDPIEAKWVPTSAYGAKFSLPYLVASGLIDGEVSMASFDDSSIARGDLLALASRVSSEHAEKGTTGFPKYFPGHLVVTLTDGRKVEKRVPINRGNPDAPLSDMEVAGKFFRNVDGLLSKRRAKMIVDKIGALESLQDLSDLSRELVM
ncbi:MmgE/PrpD family protein [Roseovarius sp. MMSF_3281]|uniref:MmgE/PrpD family protein n=1 Tax=Roseovarius sp. MMSF_3281 TaxID=3046694 RepID=UPI00273E1293|nr:MmgE/PrpD family protein [Roseovarius sp. MMSF_3281]